MAIQVPDTWQPVRILRALDRNSRSLGWPPENRNTSEMETWCTKHCRGKYIAGASGRSTSTITQSPRFGLRTGVMRQNSQSAGSRSNASSLR